MILTQRHTGNLPHQSPRNTRHDLLSSSSTSCADSHPPLPFQQLHVAFAPGPSCIISDVNVLPPPWRNWASTTAFRLYEGQGHDLGDKGDLPLLRFPSAPSRSLRRCLVSTTLRQKMRQPTISVTVAFLQPVPPWYETEVRRVHLLFDLSSHQTG